MVACGKSLIVEPCEWGSIFYAALQGGAHPRLNFYSLIGIIMQP
jgi:hypothetical protein